MAESKVNRQQLSKVTNVIISPARIRGFLDNKGINKTIENSIDKVKDQLNALKKAGGPAHPKLADDKSNEAKVKYADELKHYNEYVSEAYKNLETVYGLCKVLFKIQPLLLKKRENGKQTENQTKELEELVCVAQDKPLPRKASESEEVYKVRVEKFEHAGYQALLGNTDLLNADSVLALANKLKTDHPDVSLFLKRDELSKSRIRFNDPAAVALAVAMELGIEELLEHGMDKTRESQKKTIQPDHCVSSGMENTNWYVLFRDLPTLKNVQDRQTRKLVYTQEREKEKLKLIQKARIKSKKDKRAYIRPKFTYPSFPDDEVEKGFATKSTITTEVDGSTVTKTQYQWYGIDIDRVPSEDNTTFSFYVQQVCKKIINRRAESSPEFQEIKISTNIRKFFSDLIVDFISRVSPQIMLLIDAMTVKTVDHYVVKQVLKMMLAQNYHSASGVIEFNEDHEYLFSQIDEKVLLCQAHQTGQVHKPVAEVLDKTELGHEDDPTETKSEAQLKPVDLTVESAESKAESVESKPAVLTQPELKAELKSEESKPAEVAKVTKQVLPPVRKNPALKSK